ncbi:hypothetical protein [Actinocorallia libanotica]|uniref:Leucine rich repeat (LRR) protein n=1 Tax=Actinocorallia libanotica TaxID=46162 RepID=A0ABN1RQ79_9ACTN
MIDFDGLRADGSWRLTWSGGLIEEAVFRLVPETASGRRALVERLGADASDPEQWEAALIEALLTDPASAGLRGLELHLTDFHHSARRAARALAGRRREQLTSMYFGHDFTYLYENGTTSTGGTFDPLGRLHEGFADDTGSGLWEALPALRELTAEGGLLFDDIDGDALASLTELRLRGAVLADGAVFPRRAPGVVTLALEIGSDVFGTACPVEQLDELDPVGYPALRHLDLSCAEFDAGDFATLRTLAESPILPQLESLEIKSLWIEEHETDGDPLEALAELAPAFAHLALTVADGVDIEDAADVLPLRTC